MDDFAISFHAKEQMLNRDIDESIVLLALKLPLDIVEEDGLDVYHHVFKDGEREYLLRVYVNSEKIPPVVVTVYKTSKIKKYLL
jgi:hypothetical protein